MQLINLFPTSVGIFNLNRELTLEEKQLIINLPTKSNTFNKTSVSNYLMNSEILDSLKVFFDVSLNEYFKTIFDPSTDCSLKITQSWANYSDDGERHHIHSHQNSIVSGVFYVQTSNSDKIRFLKPYNVHKEFYVRPKEYNYFNSPEWWLPAKQCSLILFPSDLQHCVDQDTRKETRISLSFNTFISGTVGSADQLNELILP